MSTTIEQPEMFTEFEQIEKLKLDQMTLRADIDDKDRKIEGLKKRVSQKLMSMDGFLSPDEAERIIHNFNYHYEKLHGIDDSEGEMIDLKEFPNLFTWLLAFNIVKVSNPELIKCDYDQNFIAALFISLNSTPGTYGEPRSLAHANANVVYLASENFQLPGATR